MQISANLRGLQRPKHETERVDRGGEQTIKGERYRLNIVVVELDKTTSVEYQIALLAFVNCVIISAATLQDRIRMRNEFIGEYLIYLLAVQRRWGHRPGVRGQNT